MTGAFIVVEGPDGAGKTTLAARLGARLRDLGLDVLEVREPGGTPLAEVARRAALDPGLSPSPVAELFLMLAARADLVSKVIRPALKAGRVVLSDRYELSTQAYQVAGRGLSREPVLQANRLATGGLEADLTLVLDVSVDVGRARRAASGRAPDRIEEDEDMHHRVAAAFGAAKGPAIVHLDAGRAVDDVARDAWEVVHQILRKHFPRLRVESSGSSGGLA